MAAKRKPRKSSKLQVKRVCGYLALNVATAHGKPQSWLYLRKHSSTQLFIGNIPSLPWSTTTQSVPANTTIPEETQTRIRELVKLMLPCGEQVGEVFSTGNGCLATRVTVRGGEETINQILEKPGDHLYMEYWRDMHGEENCALMDKWLKEYEDERDEQKVTAWSNAAMKAYEVREKRQEEEHERRRVAGAVPDDDGFVLVTSGAKQIKAAEAKTLVAGDRSARSRYKSKAGKNRKTLLDVSKGIEKVGFYRWQRQNENALEELRKKFDADKKRIAAIRGLSKSAEDRG